MAAVALAAALVLAPATMASAAALPGQAMYPFKLAIEQLRIASVQWSPSREAGERTRVADERLDEVQDLIELKMFTQLPNALTALGKAVAAAQVAVEEAAREGEPVSGVAARLNQVEAVGGQVVQRVAVAAATGSVALPDGTREAIQAAVAQTQDVLPPPDRTPTAGTPTPDHLGRPARPRAGPDQRHAAPAGPDPGAADHRGAAAHHDHDAADHRSAHHRAADHREHGHAGVGRRRRHRGGRAGAGRGRPADDPRGPGPLTQGF